MKKLTEKQIEDKAIALSKQYDNKVTPIVITDEEGAQVIGYLQQPSYNVLMYVIDAYMDKQVSKAAETTLQDCLLREESDPRILSESRKDAKIKASFASACMKLVTPLVDEYKKK